MWYFTWVIGMLFACSFTIIISLVKEYNSIT
ncbi:cytochrome bd-I oxidase subunit CydX [Enterobacteriaceae endosymbiont of Neohaemonia nigricornis]|nr:cytochrome bd-I oxidase subunit CydX [Enterobacteriaceae endosymbiont of Neohaemonia nigricornis]QJC30398.1 cytochrome bd-I oxidase subunit CydX [Enterobacteriaceae endosymbiont of Neohaemonia nigricornis]